MANIKDITLDDVKAAFAAGRKKNEQYRGLGKTDSVNAFNTVEDFLNSNKNLKAHNKAALEAEKQAAKEAEIKEAKAAAKEAEKAAAAAAKKVESLEAK